MADTFDLTGQRLGEYQLKARLGHGGMADVYLATRLMAAEYRREFERTFAVKVLSGTTEEATRRFEIEMAILLRLNHTNIIRVYDYAVVDGLPYGVPGTFRYFVMDYLDGGTLVDRLLAPPMRVRELLDILRVVANALDFAHAEGIIHRDIKPGNVLFDRAGNPVLADFGISKLDGATTGATVDLTTGGVMLGTPPYLAPEMFRDAPANRRTDLYAFGVMTYYALAGQLPFDAQSTEALLVHILFSEPQALLAVNAAMPRPVSDVVSRMIAKNPAERYATATGFINALEQAFSPVLLDTLRLPRPGTPARADTPLVPPPSRIMREMAQAGQWRLWRGAAVLLAAALVIVLAVSILLGLKANGSESGPFVNHAAGATATATAAETATEPPSTAALDHAPGKTAPTPVLTKKPPNPTSTITPVPTAAPDTAPPARTPRPVPTATTVIRPVTPTAVSVVAAEGQWFQVDFTAMITNAQYGACVLRGWCTVLPAFRHLYEDETRSNAPVVGLDWFAAQAYCAANGGRLPLRAEWAGMGPWTREEAPAVREWVFDNLNRLAHLDTMYRGTRMPVRDWQSPERRVTKPANEPGADVGFRCVFE